jgi:6-phosphogluconolactonase
MAYACNELLSSVTTYTYNPQQGELVPVQTVSTLPPETTVSNSTAEVCVHPGGKFVYVSNRGHNSIAAFRVDEKSGRLTPTGHATAGIAVPRNFCLEPEGRWALVANQQGDSVLVFRIDPETGLFEPTPSKIEIGSPVCVRFLPVE